MPHCANLEFNIKTIFDDEATSNVFQYLNNLEQLPEYVSVSCRFPVNCLEESSLRKLVIKSIDSPEILKVTLENIKDDFKSNSEIPICVRYKINNSEDIFTIMNMYYYENVKGVLKTH